MSADLSPTLWRTARVLANADRLRVLREVTGAGRLSVTDTARRCGLSLPEATLALRALHARGLLRARRYGPVVVYEPDANPSIPFAPALAATLAEALARSGGDFAPLLKLLTAYTHPRRIEMLRRIAAGTDTAGGLIDTVPMSRQALWRHAGKLRRRGVVGIATGRYRLLPPTSPLASSLLTIALSATSPATNAGVTDFRKSVTGGRPGPGARAAAEAPAPKGSGQPPRGGRRRGAAPAGLPRSGGLPIVLCPKRGPDRRAGDA